MRLRALYRIAMVVAGVVLSLLAYLVLRIYNIEATLKATEERRSRSDEIAQELEQSSDDLALMAPLYVETGDAPYERRFHEILDIIRSVL